MRGGAAPLRLLSLEPASAPDSDAERGRGAAGPEPGISHSAQSRGLGRAEGPRAGGQQGFGAGGRLSLPGTSRSSAPGTCRASQAETLSRGGRGKPARSSPHRRATPAGGGVSPGLLSQLFGVRGGGRLVGERRRSGCVR